MKFVEHFVLIVAAMHSQGLWDDEDGFFYDVFHAADGQTIPIKVRSLVGVLPLMATRRAATGRDRGLRARCNSDSHASASASTPRRLVACRGRVVIDARQRPVRRSA